MTPPVSTEALVEKLAHELARLDGWQDPNALWTDNLGIIARGGEGSPVYLDYAEDARALVAGPLAPLLAENQRVTAERDEARAENDRFRAGFANGSGPCAYCDLSREDWSKCRFGFPGCGRADDAMLCPHFGAEMEANDRADTATAEAASLRAEVEALKGALDQTKAAADELVPVCIAEGDNKAAGALQFISGFVSDRLAAIEDTALARAATAGEGRSDG